MVKAHIEAVQQNVALKVAVVMLLAGCVVCLMQLSARTSFELQVSCAMQGGVFKPVACVQLPEWVVGFENRKFS
jgi:hypothetical protein